MLPNIRLTGFPFVRRIPKFYHGRVPVTAHIRWGL